MAFDLTQLGWKAFQDLSAAVASEVLGRPVQTFASGKDGGRDGAFLGTWNPDGARDVKSALQCKFTEKPGVRLSLSKVGRERLKVRELVAQGLAEDYVLLTNAEVSATKEAKICAAFEQEGVTTCQVFDGEWIMRQLRERPRLRMMAPRVYGLMSLPEIIVGPAYEQARAILSSMGNDLGAFVPTASHRDAVAALDEHGFVLIVGDPATGKSTIAAALALGALDGGCTGAIRISAPERLDLWRPDQRQFLWVDDAFGATQYEAAKVQQWNAELPTLKAAIENGTKIVFTTRNYIWERARAQMKLNAFDLLQSSQVVVDVQALTADERTQILYNHVKEGGHPPEVRRRLKSHLRRLSENPNLSPEIARRLGNPRFTATLPITAKALDQFVNEPVDFLKEVIANLNDAGRAALALIFMYSSAGVPNPLVEDEALATVHRLLGVKTSDLLEELRAMEGSLTLLVEGEHADTWTFRHPTIADAYADIVADNAALVELYLAGARPERIMVEVGCGSAKSKGHAVRIPPVLYPRLIARLDERPLDGVMKGFLVHRTDDAFLRAFALHRPEACSIAPYMMLEHDLNVQVLVVLHRAGALPERDRRTAAETVDEYAFEHFDPAVFTDAGVRSLLTDAEYADLEDRFRETHVRYLSGTVADWKYNHSTHDMLGLAREFKETLAKLEGTFCTSANASAFIDAHTTLDDWIEELEADQPPPRPASRAASVSPPLTHGHDIFDDIDL